MAINVETHILIIWSKAREFEAQIVEELQKEFLIKRIFTVNWDKDLFDENLKVFYSHSQKHLNEEDYDSLIQNKKEHCGDDAFTLIVFEDQHPEYENRLTSSGQRPVNKNIFDLKQSFRALTGGGHKVHTSDNTFESNKDLTLVLSKNEKDFNKSYPGYSTDPILLENNCTGVGSFFDIQQLFYVLNNSIDYCVMRNFECLPENFTVEGHGDIDLLVENLNYIKYLTNAKAVFPELDYRVHYTIKIGDEMVPFDFRFLGDNYYDIKWQMSILMNKKLFNEIIFVPDDLNYFYSLLYHAFVQKVEVKEDYHYKLSYLGEKIKTDYSRTLASKEANVILNSFMEEKNFQYTVPDDKTVYFNKLFLEHDAERESKFGQKISASQSRFENQMFFSEVYIKNDVITKIASTEIIENEIKFLDLLKSEHYFPKLIRYEKYDHFGLIQMEKIEGIALVDVANEYRFWSKKNIHNFIKDGLSILSILNAKNIHHRDVRPENFILKKENNHYRLKLIDFGWAVKTDENGNDICPHGLGDIYKFSEGEFSDAWSMGKIINNYFGMFSVGKKTALQLQKILPNYYEGGNPILEINTIRDQYFRAKPNFNLKDIKWILMQKYPMVKNIAFKVNAIKSEI